MIETLKLDQIRLSGENMRIEATDIDELAESIRLHGLLQPLVVEKDGQGYRLVCGHRRLAACRRAGLEEVACSVRTETNDVERLAVMLAENVHRKHLSPIEEGRAFQRLCEEGLTQQEVADAVGKSDWYVSVRISYLSLSRKAQKRLHEGSMTMAEADVLVKADRRGLRGGNDRQSRLPQARFTIMYADKLLRILEGGSIPLHDKDVAQRLERVRTALNALVSDEETIGQIQVRERRCDHDGCVTILSNANRTKWCSVHESKHRSFA